MLISTKIIETVDHLKYHHEDFTNTLLILKRLNTKRSGCRGILYVYIYIYIINI
jgi:hypothetical protein